MIPNSLRLCLFGIFAIVRCHPQRSKASSRSSSIDLSLMRALSSLDAKRPKRSLSGVHDLNSPPSREKPRSRRALTYSVELQHLTNQCIEIRAIYHSVVLDSILAHDTINKSNTAILGK